MKNVSKTTILLISFLWGTGIYLSAQDKDALKEQGVVKRTVQEYFVGEGMDKPVVESIESYDKNGELIELQEFNRKGEVKRWEQYSYNEDRKLTETIFLDEKGKVEHIERVLWKDGLRREKLYFNEKEKLYKRKVYEYEYAD